MVHQNEVRTSDGGGGGAGSVMDAKEPVLAVSSAPSLALDDLPVKMVATRCEEERRLELVEAWVMDCDAREIEVVNKFLTFSGLRSESLLHLKRLKRHPGQVNGGHDRDSEDQRHPQDQRGDGNGNDGHLAWGSHARGLHQLLICRRDEVDRDELDRQLETLAGMMGRQGVPGDASDASDAKDDSPTPPDLLGSDRDDSRPSSPRELPNENGNDRGDAGAPASLRRPYLVRVPAHAPLTRQQYTEWSLYWPINARFSQRERQRFWSADEVDWVVAGLREAASLARTSRLERGELGMGAVARPPMQEYWQKLGRPDAPTGLGPPRSGVCAFDTRASTGHPLAHSTMNVIEGISAAERRRRWMIDLEIKAKQGGPTPPSEGDLEQDLRQLTSHFGGGRGYTLEQPNARSATEDSVARAAVHSNVAASVPIANGTTRPFDREGKVRWPRRLPISIASKNGQDYLLTGMDLFLSHEPDALCAMALVHSRVRRVFVICMQPEEGALKSHYGLHGFKGLNHRFEVWRWRGWRPGLEVPPEWRLEVEDIKPVYAACSKYE